MEVDRKKFPHQHGTDFVSDLHIMRSAAGYYLGRSYFDVELECELPYSRESGYFATKPEANAALYLGFEPRQVPENAHLPQPHQPEHN